MCASSNGLRASQVAVGQGQCHSPDTNEYGRAIWTVNAVNHDGVTFRRFGRPNFTRSARECCSTARAYSKRRWLKSEISVVIKMVLTGFGRRVCAWLDRTLTPDSTCSGVLRGVAEDLMKCLDILIQSGSPRPAKSKNELWDPITNWRSVPPKAMFALAHENAALKMVKSDGMPSTVDSRTPIFIFVVRFLWRH
jgi:hypothetical protein